MRVIDRTFVLAKNAARVIAAHPDRDSLPIGRRQQKPGIVERRAGIADNVAGFGLRAVARDTLLLVPVGVELHAALLHQDAGIVLPGIECIAAEVALHGASLSRLT